MCVYSVTYIIYTYGRRNTYREENIDYTFHINGGIDPAAAGPLPQHARLGWRAQFMLSTNLTIAMTYVLCSV